MLALLLPLIQTIILPEIADYLQHRRDAGLPPPTLAELQAHIASRAEAIIANGAAFLALPNPNAPPPAA